MAGFVIHLAIAEQYLQIHEQQENEEQFLYGAIEPDFVRPKSDSHYGKSPAYTNLKKFLENNKINTSLKKGQFLHLVTDYLFYNHYLGHVPKEELHNDYDLINEQLIEKYKVKVPDNIKNQIYYKQGTPKHLTYELACKVIDEVSRLDLEKVKEEVLSGSEKWETYKKSLYKS